MLNNTSFSLGVGGTTGSVLSVTVNLFSFAFTSFPFAFLTVTFPCSSTSKVISVTFRYPLGAASSWNIYVPAFNLIISLCPAFDVHSFTTCPCASLIWIFAPAISSPPTFTLLNNTSFSTSSLGKTVNVCDLSFGSSCVNSCFLSGFPSPSVSITFSNETTFSKTT